MIRRRERRRAGRVVMLSTDGRVLLFRGGDPNRPEAGTWWFTPGGGTDPGETTAEAARRELLEETGLDVHVDALGPVRFRRRTRFEFGGSRYDQREDYYLLYGPAFDVDDARWSPLERASVAEWRWWPIAELRSTTETVYPRELADLAEGRPVASRHALAWPALLFLAVWCLVVLLNGAAVFLQRSAEAHAMTTDPPDWHDPVPAGVGIALFVFWVLSLNLATAGLVLGLIAALRRRSRRWWRAAALLVVVVGGAVAEFAAAGWSTNPDDAPDFSNPGFVHDGRLGGLMTMLLAVLVAVTSGRLLGYFQRK